MGYVGEKRNTGYGKKKIRKKYEIIMTGVTWYFTWGVGEIGYVGEEKYRLSEKEKNQKKYKRVSPGQLAIYWHC